MQVTAYEIYRIPSLSGGMVGSVSARLVDQTKGFSVMFKNFDPSMMGLPVKRPAYTKLPGYSLSGKLTGLHYFNKLSDSKNYMIVSHGSTVTAFDMFEDETITIESSVEENKPVYFATAADQVVYTNGEDTLRAWDGVTLKKDLGSRKASMRTYLLYADNDLEYTAKEAGKTFIKVQYVKAKSKTNKTTVKVSGSGTEEKPRLILVNLAWNNDGILSTAAQVRTAVTNHATAGNLVSVEHVSDSDGSREVTEMPGRMLTGGFDAVKGKYLIEYRTRAVVADGNKLLLSHTGDPHLWSPGAPESNSVELFVSPDDGEPITGLLNMGDGGILIGKPSTLYGLFGYKRDNFVVDMIDPTVGVSSHRSMAYARPYAYWVHRSAVYRSQPGATPERISFAIQELLDEQVDLRRIEEATAFIYNRLYVVSLPVHEGGYATYCFHIDQESWGLWTPPAGVVDWTTQENTFYLATTDQGITRLDPGVLSDDPGGIIDSEITTVELDLGLMEQEKDIGDLYLVFRGTGESLYVNIKLFFDGSTEPDRVYDNVEISGNTGKQVVLRIPVGRTARFMQVSITDDREQQLTPMALSYTYQIKDVV